MLQPDLRLGWWSGGLATKVSAVFEEDWHCSPTTATCLGAIEDPRAMLVTEIGGARPPNEIILD